MNSPTPAHGNRPGWKRWAVVAGVLALLLVLLAAAWWIKARGADDDSEQRARLLSLLDRQRVLSEQLAQIKPAAAPECPPGQSLRPIGTATAPQTGSNPPS